MLTCITYSKLCIEILYIEKVFQTVCDHFLCAIDHIEYLTIFVNTTKSTHCVK